MHYKHSLVDDHINVKRLKTKARKLSSCRRSLNVLNSMLLLQNIIKYNIMHAWA
jgi:hypothetical protein